MELVKHKFSLPVENYDEPEKLNREKRHGELLPDSIRALIVGPSNCGKTNSLMSLILHPNGLRFENVYVWSKSLEQSKYQKLREILEPIEGITFHGFRNAEEVPEKPLPHSIFVFDDLAGSCHRPIMQYFSYARHFNVDCFYLGQTYSRVPKHLIRDNANFLIVFKQDDLNLKHIYDDHVSGDVSWPEFKKMCTLCWREPYGFLTIDKDGSNFRKGFDTVFKLKSSSEDQSVGENGPDERHHKSPRKHPKKISGSKKGSRRRRNRTGKGF